MSKKSNTTQDSTTHQVVTPQNPQWVTDDLSGLAGKITDIGRQDPYSFTAGPDALQTQAAGTAGGLGTPAGYGDALKLFNGVAGAGPNTYGASTYNPATGTSASLLDGLGGYMSPYTNDVVNTSLADFDQGAGMTRAANKLAIAGGDDTFGGSNGAIQTALSENNIDRGRGALSAQLRDQAFQTGATLSNEDAGRRQQMTLADMDALNQGGQFNATALNRAGEFNATAADQMLQRRLAAGGAIADTTSAQDANTRANAGTQASIGDMLRAIQATHNAAPLSLLATQAGLLGGLPFGLFHGQTDDGTSHGTTTTTTSDPMGSMGSLAMGLGAIMGAPFTGGASLAGLAGLGGVGAGLAGAGAGAGSVAAALSDRRLKRDVVKVGELASGLGLYLFRYLWSPVLHLGVMAQEVLKVKPDAVIHLPSGFMAVDYGAL